MFISEVFHSIQGEGRFTGVPSVFVRTSGCNLRCWFCDTPYTSWEPEGTERSMGSLLKQIDGFECEHVVITGGEPLLVKEMASFTRELKSRGHFITFETAGTVLQDVQADLMSISPKLANSTPVDTDWATRHDERRHRPDVIRSLVTEFPYQLKFVIDRLSDIMDVEAWLEEFPEIDQRHVYLMPQGTEQSELVSRMAWLAGEAVRRDWQLSPRKHIELFGNTRGT